jgi:hypothetical protein
LGEDLLILSVPHSLTLLFETGSFLLGPGILPVVLFLVLHFLALVVVMIPVALGTRELARSQYRNQTKCGNSR